MTISSGFQKLTLERFDGLNTRLDPQDLPANLSPISNNAAYSSDGVASRAGTSTFLALGGGTDIYHSEFLLFNGTRYYLFLMQDNKLYYCTDTSPARTLLHTPTGSPTIFKLAVYGNFVYIFYSGTNGTYGTSGPFVWDPTLLPTIQVDLCTIPPEPTATVIDQATAVLTSTGVNVTANDVVTVRIPSFAKFGAVDFEYVFRAALANQGKAGDVLIGANAAATLENLKACINHDPSGEGSTYGIGTMNPSNFFYASAVTATTLTLTARQSGASQNAIQVTEAAVTLSWGAATFTGGSRFDAADGVQGDCDPGYHAVRVLFKTRTGYISSPADARVCLIRSTGTLPMSGIPLFTATATHVAAECTGRILIMTEAFGDPSEFESVLDTENWQNALNGSYYQALEINDNTTTTGTIDIADSQLIHETNWDAAFEFTSPLPTFSIGKMYHERMIACGNSSEPSLAYVSEIGFPQTFRADTGFRDINHEDGVALVLTFQIRDVLYFLKGLGLYATQDNGTQPNTWPLAIISSQVGTASLSGVSELSDEDFAVILDFRAGYFFNGSPPEDITEDIQRTTTLSSGWNAINIAAMTVAEVHIDSVEKRIFFLVATGSDTRPSKAFVLDYSDGWQRKKWSIWYPQTRSWRSMMMDTGGYRVLICLDSSNVQKIDDTVVNDNGIAVDYQHRTGNIEPQKSGLALVGGTDVHVTGSGNLTMKYYDPDGTIIQTSQVLALASAPGKDLFDMTNIRSERIFIDFSHNAVGASSKISRLTVFSKPDGNRAY